MAMVENAINLVLQLQKKSCNTRSCEGRGGGMLNGQRTYSGNVIWGRGDEAGDGGCLRYSDAWQIFENKRLPLLRW